MKAPQRRGVARSSYAAIKQPGDTVATYAIV